MKTLRFIGMALLAVALSVNFTACSDDDGDDDSGSITNSDEDGDDVSSSDSSSGNSSGKKLSAIVWDDGDSNSLSYDKQGRLAEVRSTSWAGTEIITFEYEEDSIICTYNTGDRIVCTLNSDGNIVKSVINYNGSPYSITSQYTYDANKQLTNILTIQKYSNTVTDEIELTWSDGCIVQAKYFYDDESYTHTYTYSYTYNSTLSSKGGIVFDDALAIDVFSPYDLCWLANAGYFGKVPAYLLSEIHSSTGKNHQITYEYYDDGYVSKMSDHSVGSVTLSWE